LNKEDRAMPLPNRVAPDGSIMATAARGTMYGNRGGCFHRDDKTLKARQWTNPHWLCCVLQFKNRRRTLMQPGKFTELFFLDEATAFAAGHRPCFECRRADALRFQALWAQTHGLTEPPKVAAMDEVLQAERLDTAGRKRVSSRPWPQVPDGAVVREAGIAKLVWARRLYPWSFEGYGATEALPRAGEAIMLTPPSTAAVLAAGYRPQVHPSATISTS
jgi:hypothetical protein